MSKSWSDMADRERDAALAALLGWTCQEEERYWPNKEQVWRDAAGVKRKEPCFTSSLEAMRRMEDLIEVRGLQDAYIDILMRIVGFSAIGATSEDFWALLRATPAQRAEAAWRVLSKQEER